jgi:hypothetical protein
MSVGVFMSIIYIFSPEGSGLSRPAFAGSRDGRRNERRTGTPLSGPEGRFSNRTGHFLTRRLICLKDNAVGLIANASHCQRNSGSIGIQPYKLDLCTHIF